MTVQQLVEELTQSVQGYAGYMVQSDRQDTIDVFITYLDGRLIKRIKSFEKQLAIWETSPEFIELAATMDELLVVMQDIMMKIKDDHEKIRPFMAEYRLAEERVLNDLVRLDHKIIEFETYFAKRTEDMNAMSVQLLKDAKECAERLQWLVSERNKRIQALNRVCELIEAFMQKFEESLAEGQLSKPLLDGIDTLMSRYPARVQTLERIMKALKDHASMFEEYGEPEPIKVREASIRLYLERLPRLYGTVEGFAENAKPQGVAEEEAVNWLKEAIAAAPDFAALSENFEKVIQSASTGESN